MKGTSKVIMGATLVMVVTLAVVLVLIFVLLAELYCSLLLRRRHRRNSNSNIIRNASTQPTTTRASASPSHTTSHPQQQSPFRSIYAQGVLQAPRSILLPAVSCKEDKAGPRKQIHYSELHQVVQIQIQPHESNLNASCSPPPSFISIAPSEPNLQHPLPCSTIENLCRDDKPSSGGEHLVYISNPIYENDESQGSGANTPFETPDTSPSRLERSDSSEEDEPIPCVTHSPPYTPPLTPMKKLPSEACSVSLRDARSLATSCSNSRSNNGLSSSSGSPCTSPSW